ncbi:MAG: helix-turn-helix transcriptional regulator [Clostridia bacterium]|nr:helix-turn-helix transcriptional regulator [Clostridia bacterium]
MSIGKNIAKYRKLQKLTQAELGAKLGVTNQAVSKWESEVSMPDVMLIPKIANALDVSLESLYGISKEPEKASISADDFPSYCHQKLEHNPLVIVNEYHFGLSLDDVDKQILDYGTAKDCGIYKMEDTWEVRVHLISTENDFPHILQKHIRPGVLVDGYSVRIADGKAIDDDKPNKYYVCREKVWEYKNTDIKYLKAMRKEQVDMGFVDKDDDI